MKQTNLFTASRAKKPIKHKRSLYAQQNLESAQIITGNREKYSHHVGLMEWAETVIAKEAEYAQIPGPGFELTSERSGDI